jgi:arylsulfatase A-like enzyme
MLKNPKQPFFIAAGLVLILAAATLFFLRSPKVKQPRLVLVIATCTVNKDYLGPYNTNVSTTPFLERFAREALVFENHYSEAEQSGTAYASIFSGNQATRHGIFAHPGWLDDSLVLLPEVFADEGYETHSWLQHGMASAIWNYAQGVELWNQHHGRLDGRDLNFRNLLTELKKDPDRRALVVTNFTVTHRPYSRTGKSVFNFCLQRPGAQCESIVRRPEFWDTVGLFAKRSTEFAYDTDRMMRLAESRLGVESAGRLPEAIELLYRADISKLDSIVEGIVGAVEEQGLLDDSLIIFTADHGEAMHADAPFRWSHSFQLTPEVLNVPLIIRGPNYGVPAGRYTGVTRSIDLLPTLAGLAGLSLPTDDIAGFDLSAAVRRESEPPELLAFSHTSLPMDLTWDQYKGYAGFRARFPTRNPQLMWVSARSPNFFFRLHRTSKSGWQPEAFDLNRDPLALGNIYDEADMQQRTIINELKRYQEDLVTAVSALDFTVPSEVFERQENALRSLGYIE